MKSLSYFTVFLILMSLNWVSCQKEEIQVDAKVLNNEVELPTMHVIYDGKDYYSECSLLGDSLIIKNELLSSLIDNLYLENAEVQTFFHEDGTIEYFENKETFYAKYNLKNIKGEEVENIATKSNYDQYDGYALMYMDINYGGLMLDAVNMFGKVPQEYNMSISYDKKISSIKIFHFNQMLGTSSSSILECYDEPGRRGNCLRILHSVRIMPGLTPDLSTVPFGKKGNWNDRISSIRFSVVK